MIAIGTVLRARRVHHLLQGWHDSGGQWRLRDVQRHRHQAVVADGADEIDDAALAEGVVAETGAAWARLDRVGHALLIRGHRLRRQRRESLHSLRSSLMVSTRPWGRAKPGRLAPAE